jgi:hypothetical protein
MGIAVCWGAQHDTTTSFEVADAQERLAATALAKSGGVSFSIGFTKEYWLYTCSSSSESRTTFIAVAVHHVVLLPCDLWDARLVGHARPHTSLSSLLSRFRRYYSPIAVRHVDELSCDPWDANYIEYAGGRKKANPPTYTLRNPNTGSSGGANDGDRDFSSQPENHNNGRPNSDSGYGGSGDGGSGDDDSNDDGAGNDGSTRAGDGEGRDGRTRWPSKMRSHVDYLSHDWQEEEIWAAWRHIVSQREVYGRSSRVENAAWRSWAKVKYRLELVSPETLNWYVLAPYRRLCQTG